MTKIKFNSQSPKKDVKEEIHNPKFRDVDIHTDQVGPPKTKPEHKPSKEIEQHFLDSRTTPKNKIRPPKLPPNYLTKNKITPPKNKPAHKPINKIEQPTLEPHYTPKSKIRPPKLPPNYLTKNKIEPPKNKPAHKPINKIEQPTLEPHYTTINKITPPKLQLNYTPKNKIIPPKPVDKKEPEKSKNQPNSKPNTHSNQKSWKFMNYDQNGNLLSREQKLKAASEYYTSNVLPKLKGLPEIQQKLNAGKSVGWRDLWHNGFSGFFAALTRHGTSIKWNEFKEFAGYKVNIDQDKYRFLNYNQNGNRLTKNEKLQVAIKYFSKVILPNLKNIPEIKEKLNKGKPPTVTDLIRHGHPGFIGPLSQKHPKIRYNELLRKLDFRPNVVRGKYKFLNYDRNNDPIPSNEKLHLAVKHFKENIIPTLIKKGEFKEGEQITRKILDKNGFQHFSYALINDGAKVSFNQLLIKAGYEINIDHEKWAFLKYNHEGEILSLKEKMKKAVDYFNNTIYPDLVQKRLIKNGESPTTFDLRKADYGDFIGALRGKNPKISFNNLITSAGFEPKSPQDHEKWKIFYDENMNPLPREKQIQVAVNYFIQEVIPDLIKKQLISEGQTPDTNTLLENDHYDFFKAINRRDITYNELVIEAGYTPNLSNVFSNIGRNLHWTVEDTFLKHTRRKNCESFYEVSGNGDNSIIVDENFGQLSPLAEKFTHDNPKIKIINVDYYIGASKRAAIDHSLRGYQDRDKALILVPIHAKNPQLISEDIPYSMNVHILNPKKFAQFMGYKGDIYHEFMENVYLARTASYIRESEERLIEKSLESFESIIRDFNYSSPEFEEFIENS